MPGSEGLSPGCGRPHRTALNRINAGLCTLFIFVLLSVPVHGVRARLQARAANRPTVQETPFFRDRQDVRYGGIGRRGCKSG